MTEQTMLAPVVRNAEEAEPRWFYGGGVHTWLATAEDTGGAFLLFHDVMEKGKRTPLHTHPETEETMYVLDGEILMHMDGTESQVRTGGVVMAPRHVPHAFLVVSDTATVLALQTPGICQAFYMGASEPLTDETERIVDFDRIRESGEINGGIKILGPPPFPGS